MLSPLDGVRAGDLPFDRLQERIESDGVTEVINIAEAEAEIDSPV